MSQSSIHQYLVHLLASRDRALGGSRDALDLVGPDHVGPTRVIPHLHVLIVLGLIAFARKDAAALGSTPPGSACALETVLGRRMAEQGPLIGCTCASVLQSVRVGVGHLVKLLTLGIEASTRRYQAAVALAEVEIVLDLLVIAAVAAGDTRFGRMVLER